MEIGWDEITVKELFDLSHELGEDAIIDGDRKVIIIDMTHLEDIRDMIK